MDHRITFVFLVAIAVSVHANSVDEPAALSSKLRDLNMRKVLVSFTEYFPKFDTGYRYVDTSLKGLSIFGLASLAYGLFLAWYPGSTITTGRSDSTWFAQDFGRDFIWILESLEKFDVENITGNYLDVRDHRCKKRVACELRYNLAKYPTIKLLMQILLGINGKSARLLPSSLDECIHMHSDCTTSLSDVLLRKTIKLLGRK